MQVDAVCVENNEKHDQVQEGFVARGGNMAGQVGIEVALSKVKILPVDVQESLKKVQQYVADEDGPHSQ